MRLRIILALSLLMGAITPGFAQLASPYSQSVWPAQTFTATNQTGSTIQLNGLQVSSTVGSSFASGTLTVTGTSLTTVTFAVQGSSDNGATFYALPIYTVASPTSTPTTTVTATGNGIYQVSLAGITHVRIVTSGTFTATNVSIVFTSSPNAGVAKNGSNGGGSLPNAPGVGYAPVSTAAGTGSYSPALVSLTDTRPSIIQTTGKGPAGEGTPLPPSGSVQVFSATGPGTITYLHLTMGIAGSDYLNLVENSTMTINCDGNPQIVTLGSFLLSQDLPAPFNTDYIAIPANTEANISFNRRTRINFLSSCTITINNASASITGTVFLDTTYRTGTPAAADHWNAFTFPLQAVPGNNNPWNYPQVYLLPLTTFTGGGSLEWLEEFYSSAAGYTYLEASTVVNADSNVAAIANGGEDFFSSGYYCNAVFGTALSATDNKWGCIMGAGLQRPTQTYDFLGYRWWTSNSADNLLFNSTLSVSSANGDSTYLPGTNNLSSLVTYFTNTATVAQVNYAPPAGSYGGTQSVALSGGPSGDSICYTNNGTTPVPNGSGGCSTGTLYSAPVSVASSETLTAIAAKSGYNTSPVDSALYTISAAPSVTSKTCSNYVGTGTTLSCTWSAAPVAGEFVVVGAVDFGFATGLSVTDSNGDTYTAAAAIHTPTYVGGATQLFYFGPLTASITSLTITATGGSGLLLNANTATNIAASSPLDGSQCTGDANVFGLMSCGTAITTTVSNDLVFCNIGSNTLGAGITVGSGFTQSATFNADNMSQYKIQSSTGALTPTATISNGGGNNYSTMICAAFKP